MINFLGWCCSSWQEGQDQACHIPQKKEFGICWNFNQSQFSAFCWFAVPPSKTYVSTLNTLLTDLAKMTHLSGTTHLQRVSKDQFWCPCSHVILYFEKPNTFGFHTGGSVEVLVAIAVVVPAGMAGLACLLRRKSKRNEQRNSGIVEMTVGKVLFVRRPTRSPGLNECVIKKD